MKRFSILFITTLAAMLICVAAGAEIFRVPDGIKDIGSEAFSDIGSDGVFLPETVNECAEDAFPDTITTIYGLSGTWAETYAADTGRRFVAADISDVCAACSAFVSPGETFEVTLSCAGALPADTYALSVEKDGNVYFSAVQAQPVFNIALTEPGVYDFNVTCSSGYASASAFIDDAVEVYEPARLVENYFRVAPGETVYPADETETRDTVFSCVSDAFSFSGTGIAFSAPGTYTVTATVDCGTGYCKSAFTVEVLEPVTGITLSDTKLCLPVGSAYQLSYTLSPAELQDRTVTWSSSAESVVTVDANGTLTAAGAGTATVTCSTFRAEASITVSVYVPVESILISTGDRTAFLTGESVLMHAAILPDSASDPAIAWRTSDDTVAMVNEATGYISFVGPGTVTVTAESEDGSGVCGTLELTVLQSVEEIGLTAPSYMTVGETYKCSSVCLPENAAGSEITYSSGDESVISVSEDGLLTAAQAGTAVIRAQAENGAYVESTVTVYKSAEALTPRLTSVYVSASKSFELSGMLTVSPAGALDFPITYESDSDCVSVSENGRVTGISAGTAVITARLGPLACQVAVSVVGGTGSVAVSPTYACITAGQTAVFTPSFSSGTDASLKSGVWTVADTSIARITAMSSGYAVKVTGVSSGTTELTFISASGSRATVSLLVNPRIADSIALEPVSVQLEAGDTAALTCTFSPSGSREQLTWSSGDADVAEVDANGVVTARSAGSVVITAVTPSGCRAECTVTVAQVDMESAATDPDISGFAGNEYNMVYTYAPSNASPAAFEWYSDDESVFCFTDARTGRGLFVSAGETDVHGYAIDGSGLVLTSHVTVSEIPVRTLSVNTEAVSLKPGETYSIICSVFPENASYAQPRFSSSDTSVATVSENGVITAVSAGSCALSVTVGYGSYEKTYDIAVSVESDSTVTYRALIMGQYTDPSASNWLPFSLNGTGGVGDALSRSVIGGESYSVRLMQNSPSVSSFRSAIRSIAALADEDDVTVIYVIAHGHDTSAGYCFSTSSGDYVTGSALLQELEGISGHVVLCLCTCHSGLILETSEARTLMANGGVYTGTNGTGKLSIITSSSETKSSYYNVSNTKASYDFFTKAFTSGLGWNMISDCAQVLSADADRSGGVTLSELAAWTRTRTQYLISTFIQKNGTGAFSGNASQYPDRFIADGDADLIILAR